MLNLNEVLLEKIRNVEEYDPSTSELMGRYTQIENPSLKTSANGTDITDAVGTPIHTIYNAQTGTFDFTNSLHSIDLLATQYCTTKEIATDVKKIRVPVSEVLTINETTHTVTLKYTPVGALGSEVKFAKIINENNTFGETFTVSATAGEGKFVLDTVAKTLTFQNDVTGRVFVNYYKDSEEAVKVTKLTDTTPSTRELHINATFADICDTNKKYIGVIVIPRAQIDISSTELNLTPDGKHGASYQLKKPYCDETAKLFDIIISE